MKNISKFDLGAIIAFVVIGLLGGGAVWYLSTQLDAARDEASANKASFDKYSTTRGILVSTYNKKILEDNIALLHAQMDPVLQDHFLSKDNKLATVSQVNPVAWKHDLDQDVHRLTDTAKHHNIGLPDGFYFGFSRYQNRNPDDAQTVILGQQLLIIKQLTDLLYNAPVQNIQSLRRTYEEDAPAPSRNGNGNGPGAPAPTGTYLPGAEPDRLVGFAANVDGLYTDYPYTIEFDSSVEGLRKFMSDLMKSPYVFVVRSVAVENSVLGAPRTSDLDTAPATPSVTETSPGTVAVVASASTHGTQYLFGNRPLHVKMRVDLIVWNGGKS